MKKLIEVLIEDGTDTAFVKLRIVDGIDVSVPMTWREAVDLASKLGGAGEELHQRRQAKTPA